MDSDRPTVTSAPGPLRLSARALRDAQGGHFDRYIVTQRFYGVIAAWMDERALPPAQYPSFRATEDG
eukprot:6049932-Lingulodinium_polyedra.AAC.1